MRKKSTDLAPGVKLLPDGSLTVERPDRTGTSGIGQDALTAATAAIRRQGVHESPKNLAAAALEAAAPSMHARALEDAVEAFPLETITAPDNAVVWLSNRASRLRGIEEEP